MFVQTERMWKNVHTRKLMGGSKEWGSKKDFCTKGHLTFMRNIFYIFYIYILQYIPYIFHIFVLSKVQNTCWTQVKLDCALFTFGDHSRDNEIPEYLKS